jgi:hypothetical protein
MPNKLIFTLQTLALKIAYKKNKLGKLMLILEEILGNKLLAKHLMRQSSDREKNPS